MQAGLERISEARDKLDEGNLGETRCIIIAGFYGRGDTYESNRK